MMPELNTYRIFSLGDCAITLDFGNTINEAINKEIIARFNQLTEHPLPGMIEVVPAYSSLTVYYDVFQLRKQVPAGQTVCEWITGQLEIRMESLLPENNFSSKIITIPVCYEKEFAPDIEEMARVKNIPVAEVIQIHTSKTYRVYMLGFLPGFAYMGEVEKKIEMPRKLQPVKKVEAGSIGIAGRQTGIYPLASPGGWQIIGRTPLKLFDATKKEPTLLKAGDRVQFISISKNEFENY